jgi:hypothetical protein
MKVDMAKATQAFIGSGDAAGAAKKPKSEFLCDLQFTNYLPDMPFEPKLLKIHLPPQRSGRGTCSDARFIAPSCG